MIQPPPNPVSRDIVHAILTTRDHRHNEMHAMLVSLFQGLVTELVEQGAMNPALLASRLSMADATIRSDAHGLPARDMLNHVIGWLQQMEPGLPPPHPDRWFAPGPDKI